MNEKEIKKANRKAMPKFLLIVVISAIVGGGIGFFSAEYGVSDLTGGMKRAGAFWGAQIAPWFMMAMVIILPAICVPIYRSARKLLLTWDGENEEISGVVEEKLSIAMWISSVAFVFSYFLIASSYSGGFAGFKNMNIVLFFTAVAAFLGIMVESTLIQQKCVDTIKKMNPEKTASVYDVRFQKKWMDSCDEAEKIIVGKCAYKAYATTNTVCAVLAIVLAIGALMFDIGFLPSFVVSLIWIVNLSVYCREAIRCSKAGNKIS